ncbi:MAG: hypothetical protein IKU07_01195, partial [Oscillospiraceae bacterium]|nr:hypothetical protein [Oscillospiraceae bacterium]
MSKKINFLYTVCWYCLAWALIAAIPHEPFFQSVAYGVAYGAELAQRWMKILAYMLVLNLLITMLWLNLRMTVTQLKRIQWIAKLLRDLSFVAVGELLYTWAHMNGAELRLSQGLAVLMLGLLVCLGAALSSGGTPAKKSSAVWKIAVLVAAVAGLGLWIPGMWGITLPALQIPGELFGHYVGQLSLTFITISVMSVLSEKSVVVYWENIAEAKLIKPLFGSFASYTLYSIAATVGAGISVCLNSHLGFAFFF